MTQASSQSPTCLSQEHATTLASSAQDDHVGLTHAIAEGLLHQARKAAGAVEAAASTALDRMKSVLESGERAGENQIAHVVAALLTTTALHADGQDTKADEDGTHSALTLVSGWLDGLVDHLRDGSASALAEVLGKPAKKAKEDEEGEGFIDSAWFKKLVTFCIEKQEEALHLSHYYPAQKFAVTVPKDAGHTTKAARIQEQLLQLEEPFISAGSVLLVAGPAPGSLLNRLATGSRFSHVAFIARGFLEEEGVDVPLLWQAAHPWKDCRAQYTPPGAPADYDKTYGGPDTRMGADLHYMARYLAAYPGLYPGGRFVLRRLAEPDSVKADALKRYVDERLIDPIHFPCFLHEMEHFLIGLLAKHDVFDWIEPSHNEMFCAELVASTYQNIALLPEHPIAPSYVPFSFGFRNVSKSAPLGPARADVDERSAPLHGAEVELVFKSV